MKCVDGEELELINIATFSNLEKVVRIMAWVVRYLNCLKKVKPNMDTLTAEELRNSEDILVKLTQAKFFESEIRALQSSLPIPASSTIFNLAPYLDEKGILRITGRLDEGDYSFDEKKPIIIPRQSKFTELPVKREHENVFHSGVESTLVQIRRRFWVPKGRQLIKKVVSKCLICRRYTAKPSTQMTGQLPKDPISETPAFTVCGIDFAGPIYIKGENGIKKSYIALFTCAVTRAIHLELVSDMSTSTFLLAFRRFLSRRGGCHTIYSDNAKTFKCTDKELQRLFDILENSEFKNFLAAKRISWKFIVQLAPWWGGFYERLVKSVKEPLKKILRKALLNFEEMTTILTEIETIVNLRPLSYVTNEIGEPEILTPSQFLTPGKEKAEYPAHFIETIHRESTKKILIKRKEYQATLLANLWKRWKERYLFNLRSAHNFTSPNLTKCLKVGDVVLMEGTTKSKLLWDIGIITKVFQGRDGLVRSCLIRKSNGEYKRPVQLIYPLELND
nr:uncharacterized protein LOC122269764 [Parasteatoda tepidariorum]